MTAMSDDTLEQKVMRFVCPSRAANCDSLACLQRCADVVALVRSAIGDEIKSVDLIAMGVEAVRAVDAGEYPTFTEFVRGYFASIARGLVSSQPAQVTVEGDKK